VTVGVSFGSGATSRRTSVAGTHAVDPVEAKGLRLEVVGSCLATVVAPERGSGPAAGQETREMTTDKARKRAVRTRMEKTGERYAAARRNVVHAGAPTGLPPRVADPGMSDASIVRGTGRTWDEWLRILDDWDATTKSHTEIARYVQTGLGVPGWWSQSVTVGYERARGMRSMHETSSGFEVSVSKTVPLDSMDAWRAFVEPARRASWLDLGLRLRTGTRTMGRSARFDVLEDGTRIHVAFTPKDPGRTTVTVTHVQLGGPDDVAARRVAWKARLEGLAAGLATPRATGRRRRAS
jgi:hypothetical protein